MKNVDNNQTIPGSAPEAADKAVGADGHSASPAPKKPVADPVKQMIDHLAAFEVFRDQNQVPYITVPVEHHEEYLEIRGAAFGHYLDQRAFALWQRVLVDSQKEQVVGAVAGRALFAAEQREVHCRIAGAADRLYIDLGQATWNVVEISPCGWKVLDKSPIRFRRTATTTALPTPEPGGTIGDLRPFVNSRDEDFVVIVAFILACFRAKGPYPILEIVGEAGGAKSTVTRLVQRLVDPTSAVGRGQAKSEQDLAIAAHNRWLIAWDNCSDISHQMSDVLCRLSTGGTFATRQLYTDAGESVLHYCRPCVLNGIANLARRSDLLDRCWNVEVQRIPPEQRRREEEFWAAFELAAPRIFGSVCDALVVAMREGTTTVVPTSQRLADAEAWACAGATAFGWSAQDVQRALRHRQLAGWHRAVEEHPTLWTHLRRLASLGWEGTVAELMEETGQDGSASAFGGVLRRLQPACQALGVDVQAFRKGHASTRHYSVRTVDGLVGADGLKGVCD